MPFSIMMKFSRPILIGLALIFAALLVGCTSPQDQYSSIPQARPAGWEGQIPGVGSTQGAGTRY
ncbi:MAG: hypothetical protein KGJ37_05230 [Verrucomicrobiota bacterium]|nr:hypothetical protein [Verrucomicrobiota bacterium]